MNNCSIHFQSCFKVVISVSLDPSHWFIFESSMFLEYGKYLILRIEAAGEHPSNMPLQAARFQDCIVKTCQKNSKDLVLWYIDTPSAAPFPAPLVASLQFSRRPVGCPEPTQCRIRFLMTSHHMSAQSHSAQYHEMCCWGRHAQWSRLADTIAAQGKNSTVMDQSAFVRKRPTIVFWVRQLESRSVDLNWILMGLILYNVWICLELSGYPLQTDPYPKASRSNPPSGHELTPPPSAWRSPSTAFQSWEPPGAGRRWGNGNWQIERAK